MLIAGGVYVERCVAPDTTQLLGSGGRAALALSTARRDLTLHIFHPPELWADLRANFVPSGIAVVPHAAAERIVFSYLFPLGRPVQTPARPSPAAEVLIEGDEILGFGCVEGHFVIQGRAVVYDFQGAVGRGFRRAGSSAGRLALVMNRQEVMSLTGGATVGEAAGSLLRDEAAEVVVVKDGPRGALVFDADGGEAWVPPYASSQLYKIGSGDIFSAVFADRWLLDGDAASAADHASRRTAAYVDSPVLPLAASLTPTAPRLVEMPGKVYVAAHLPSLAHRWFAAVVEEALHHIGVDEVEILDLGDWLDGRRPAAEDTAAAVLLCVPDRRLIGDVRLSADPAALRQVVFLDEGTGAPATTDVVTDLSQALYELCWRAS